MGSEMCIRDRALAENEQSPAELLTLLAKDQDRDVRKTVAENSKAPAEALTLLTKDRSKDVREAVACKQKPPAELLTLLALRIHTKTSARWLQGISKPLLRP